MKKKLFILFAFIMLFSALTVMPAFASCDDCIATTENIDWSNHCEAHCTCEWDICGSCGDGGTYLDVYCGKTHKYSGSVTKEATCTGTGTITYSCACGDSYTETIAVLQHNYSSSTVAATCESGGYTMNTCSRCGYSYKSSSTSALGHNYSSRVVPPSCTSGGYTVYTCSRCDDSYTGNSTGAKGHSMKEVDRDEATCTASGKIYYECSDCGESSADTIPPLGHSYSSRVVSPSCTSGGYTVHVCTRCDDSYTDAQVSATGHSMREVGRDEPTCVSEGRIYYECSDCGETSSDTLSTVSHSMKQVGVTHATCTTSGKISYECTVCGETETTTLNKLGHDYCETEVIAPTCTSKGYTRKGCSRCSAYQVVAGSETAMLGHNFGEPFYSSKFSSGYGRDCSNCDYYEDLVPDECNHVNRQQKDGTYVAPTCTEKGYVTMECTDCHYEWTKYYSALGYHTWSDPFYADKFSTGYGRECSVCDLSEPLDPPPCTHENKTLVEDSALEATCTAPGTVTYKCPDCDIFFMEETEPAKGHVWTDPYYGKEFSNGYGRKCTVCFYADELARPSCEHTNREPIDGSDVPATCTEPGYISYKCLTCEITWQETIPALTHDYTVRVSVPGTCQKDGYTYYKCSREGCTSYSIDEKSYIAGDHVPEVISSTPATCTTTGLNQRKCSLCGVDLDDEIVPATGHRLCDPVVIAPKCTEIGFTLVQCLNAGCNMIIKSDEKDALGHNYTNGVCSTCGAVQQSNPSQSEHEHIWNTVEIIKATCKADGQTIQECACGEKQSIPIEKLSHVWSVPQITAPTCVKPGYTRTYCLNGCGEEQITDPTEALGHEYVDGVCTRCRVLEKLPETTAPSVPDQGEDEGKDDVGSVGSIFDGIVEVDEELTPLFLRYLGMVIFFMIIFAALAPDPKKRKRRRRRR